MCVTRLDRERSSNQEAKVMRTLMRLLNVETMALRTQPRARAFNARAVFLGRTDSLPKIPEKPKTSLEKGGRTNGDEMNPPQKHHEETPRDRRKVVALA